MAILLAVSMLFFFGCKDPEIPQESTGGTETPEKPGDTNKPETPDADEPEVTYTVKFYYSDESSAGEDVTGKKAGEVVTLPTISEKANKTFSGWYLTKTATGNAVSSSLSGGKYTVKATDAKEGIIKLYAVYIENSSAIEVVSISVSPSTVSNLQVGSTQQLTVSYNPVDANVGNSVTWKSSSESVATVDGNGLVKAVSAGNAVITVTSANGKSTTVNVTVVPKPKVLLSVELGKTNDTTFTATAKYDDSTTEEVTNTSSWVSTNTSVATVNNGVVEVVGEGTTEISASYTYNGVTKETGSATIVSKANLSSGNALVVYMLSSYGEVQGGGNLYAWKGDSNPYGSWPGSKMTLTSDSAAYYFVIEDSSKIENLIINNNSKQTKDMSLPASSGHWLCWHDGSDWAWKEYDGVLADVGEPDGTFSVTVTMPSVQEPEPEEPDNPVIPDDPIVPDEPDEPIVPDDPVEPSDPIVTDYYWTNKDGAVGKNKTITIDGDSSDWTEDMKIVQNMANDDPRVYCPWAMHEMPIDLYSLYAAWDNDNLYLMFEFTNVQDIVATEDRDPLYNDLTSANLPIFLAFNTGASKSGNGKMDASGATLWGSGTTWDMAGGIDTVIVNSTKFNNGNWIYKVNSSGYLEEFAGAMGETDTVYTNGNNRKGSGKGKTTGINWARDQGIASKSIYGIRAVGGELAGRIAGDTEVATSANVVDFNTLGHDSDTYDLCYEVSIPFSQLGITKETLTSKGIGVSVIGTMGLSAMDCLPWCNTMIDVAADPYSQDGSTSAEKDDSDSITTPLARIGKM